MENRIKIGIVTYHRGINYGAVLQSYALSKKLSLLGYDCEVIDYQSLGINKQYQYMPWKDRVTVKSFFIHNLTVALRKNKKKKFQNFIKKLPLTETCDKNNIYEISKRFDVIISGSDQVFNPVCNANDTTFFLDYVNDKTKISYAASLGSIDQFEKATFNTIDLLKNFKYLSFREKIAAEYISKKIQRECYTVVDPVWLLNKNEWNDLISDNVTGKYILVYSINEFYYMKKFVKNLIKKTGIRVIRINRTIKGDIIYFNSATNKSNCSPEEFLGYIKNAMYVVTDSFHGTCFSMIFNKNFYVALNPQKDNTNSRLENILEIMQLRSRIIAPNGELREIMEIDYSKKMNIMDEEIKQSIHFLQDACEDIL